MLDLHVEILKSMRATPVILRAMVAGAGDSLIRYRPAPGEWAIVEVAGHLADVDERAHARLRRMLREDEPFLPGYDQDALVAESGYIDADLTELVARYNRSREAHAAEVSGLDEAQWARRARHEEHGVFTVELYEAHVASEDVDHLAQIARILGTMPAPP